MISRRSRGLSIGINLNVDGVCNFNCAYCQVDRSGKRPAGDVDLARLGKELASVTDDAQSGSLFDDPAFAGVPSELRAIKDIAFSGDGEPTTCMQFRPCVKLVADLKQQAQLSDCRIVLITNASNLTEPDVQVALSTMDRNKGEIWAKLDAGTEDYFHRINRAGFRLEHVVQNIISTARVRPIVIQSIFMRLHDQPPGEAELTCYTDRLIEIIQAGGRIDYVQVYTIARRPAEDYITALSDTEVDQIATLVQTRAGLTAKAFYGR